MSQTYTVDCYGGAHVWSTDLQAMENNFEALRTHFSGTSQPSNAIAGMTWYDTTKKVTKRRDYSNNAWHGLLHGDVNTKIWMYKNTALEGWVIDSSVADVVLALKGGTAAYNATGGTIAGTQGKDHILSQAELPSVSTSAATHTHALVTDGGVGSGENGAINYDFSGFPGGYYDHQGTRVYTPVYGNVVAESSHVHSLGGSGTAHNHGDTQRPYAAIGTLQYLDL